MEGHVRIVQLEKNAKKDILSNLSKRDLNNYDSYTDTTQQIMDGAKERQDAAVSKYTAKFDNAALDAPNVRATKAEIEEATGLVEPLLLEVMKKSMKNIQNYHQKQVQHSWLGSKPDGTALGQKVTALESVGVYVPGRKAAYSSFVPMDIIPAEVAGAKHIVVVMPPGRDGEVSPVTLTTAHLVGATEVYKASGAQAAATPVFGMESIPRINKTVGSGNTFMALAKKAVYGHVSIDSTAGPSEILVLTDGTANSRFVVADLLPQAEHDELASTVLATASMELVEKVSVQVNEFVKELSRKEILEKSLENFGYTLVTGSMEDAVDTASEITSEHLEIVTKDPFEVIAKIQNAGAISIGEYSSEPLGDYFARPSHVLPTNGTARFFSPLGVDDFIKKSSTIYYSKEALKPIHKDVTTLTEAEQLTVHANSTEARLEEQVDQR